LRDELLSSEIFTTLAEAQLLTQDGVRITTIDDRKRQASMGGIRGKVQDICDAKVGAPDGNGGKHKKGGIDYDPKTL
jgi:hypothetical protein